MIPNKIFIDGLPVEKQQHSPPGVSKNHPSARENFINDQRRTRDAKPINSRAKSRIVAQFTRLRFLLSVLIGFVEFIFKGGLFSIHFYDHWKCDSSGKHP